MIPLLLSLALGQLCIDPGTNLTCSSTASGIVTVDASGGGGGSVPSACSAGQAVTSNGSALVCTSTLTASDVVCGSTCVADAEIAAVSGGKVSGAVATATALAADPADCSAGQYATAIAASGALTCAQVTTAQLSGTVSVSQGGTGAAPGGADQVLVSTSSSAATWQTLPSCSNATTSKLLYDTATDTFSCGTDQTGGGGGGTSPLILSFGGF